MPSAGLGGRSWPRALGGPGDRDHRSWGGRRVHPLPADRSDRHRRRGPRFRSRALQRVSPRHRGQRDPDGQDRLRRTPGAGICRGGDLHRLRRGRAAGDRRLGTVRLLVCRQRRRAADDARCPPPDLGLRFCVLRGHRRDAADDGPDRRARPSQAGRLQRAADGGRLRFGAAPAADHTCVFDPAVDVRVSDDGAGQSRRPASDLRPAPLRAGRAAVWQHPEDEFVPARYRRPAVHPLECRSLRTRSRRQRQRRPRRRGGHLSGGDRRGGLEDHSGAPDRRFGAAGGRRHRSCFETSLSGSSTSTTPCPASSA